MRWRRWRIAGMFAAVTIAGGTAAGFALASYATSDLPMMVQAGYAMPDRDDARAPAPANIAAQAELAAHAAGSAPPPPDQGYRAIVY